MSAPLRRIRLCADDYGLAPAGDAAIRDLIARGRLNATSVMVVAPSFDRATADALTALAGRAQIGLHVTLTAPFHPVSDRFSPLAQGTFPSLPTMLRLALLHRLDPAALGAEIAGQIHAFVEIFGRPPDFVDGHQHVQLFPHIDAAFTAAVAALAPNAWVRHCGRALPLWARFADGKGLLLDLLSRRFRRRAAAQALATNPAFAGTYRFDRDADFAALFPGFLAGLPDGGLVMCHPGLVDAELTRLDPLTHLREREYAYFASDMFPQVLAAHGVALA
jgi:chitin disaccharide deacetylase